MSEIILPGKRVLVCDDETLIMMQLRRALCQIDLEIVGEANCGKYALAIALQERPDIIMLDVGLPDIDGIAVARQIMEVYSACIIIMTGYNETESRAHEVGACGFIHKPVTARELPTILTQAHLHYLIQQSDETAPHMMETPPDTEL